MGGRLGVPVLINNQPPVTGAGWRCPEVLEVESKDWEIVPLGDRHHGCVREPEVEVLKTSVDCDRPLQEPGREVCDLVLALAGGLQKEPRRPAPDAGAQQLVSFDQDRLGDQQVSTQLAHQRGRERVRLVAPVGGGKQRTGIRNDLQRDRTSWRR